MASSELLKQIQTGKKLKKTETNDRSAPAIESKPSGAGAGPRAPTFAPTISPGGGPPQLGGLFAGGVPKLKSAGQSNPVKPSTLGKPPAVPGRTAPSPASGAALPLSRATLSKPSTPAPPPPYAPAPPSRVAPALPSRAPANLARAPQPPARATPSPPSPAPAPPRRPPPPPRTASPPASLQAPPPPARPSPSVAVRNTSLVDTPTPSARAAPPPPARFSNATLPARKAPPPPPARPSSVGGSTPSRAAPSLPTRKVPIANGPSAASVHVRVLSETNSSPPPPPPGPSSARANLLSPSVPAPSGSQRSRVVSTPSEAPPRPSAALSNGRVNGTRRAAPTRKIPSPPPEAGSHRFPTSDFPPPRQFTPEPKLYGGGRQRGSDFDLSNI